MSHRDKLDVARRAYRIARAFFTNHTLLGHRYQAELWEQRTLAAHRALMRTHRRVKAPPWRPRLMDRSMLTAPDFDLLGTVAA